MITGIYFIEPSQLNSFETDWLGGETDMISTTYTAGNSNWDATYISWTTLQDPQDRYNSLTTYFGNGTNRTLMTLFHHGGSDGKDNGDWSTAANGNFDSNYNSFAQQLVNLELGDAYIVGTQEFNQSWSTAYPNDPANYGEAFARMVKEFRSVSGQSFTFVFAPNSNAIGNADQVWSAMINSTHWPSDEPEPIVAPSFYDASGAVYPDDISGLSDSQLNDLRDEAWHKTLLPQLETWRTFAENRNAPIGLREWGCANNGWSNPAGGDNEKFIHRVFDYGRRHNFEMMTYWNEDSNTGGSHKIYPRNAAGLVNASEAVEKEITKTKEYNWFLEPVANERENWHIPLNNNFKYIENTLDYLSSKSGTSIIGNYNKPPQGQTDWGGLLNQNFQDIDSDVTTLGNSAGVSNVGGYTIPTFGQSDWTSVVNQNFDDIQSDIEKISLVLH